MGKFDYFEFSVAYSWSLAEFQYLCHFIDIGKNEAIDEAGGVATGDSRRMKGEKCFHEYLDFTHTIELVSVEPQCNLRGNAKTDVGVCVTGKWLVVNCRINAQQIHWFWLVAADELDDWLISYNATMIVGVACAHHRDDDTNSICALFCIHDAIDDFVITSVTADGNDERMLIFEANLAGELFSVPCMFGWRQRGLNGDACVAIDPVRKVLSYTRSVAGTNRVVDDGNVVEFGRGFHLLSIAFTGIR